MRGHGLDLKAGTMNQTARPYLRLTALCDCCRDNPAFPRRFTATEFAQALRAHADQIRQNDPWFYSPNVARKLKATMRSLAAKVEDGARIHPRDFDVPLSPADRALGEAFRIKGWHGDAHCQRTVEVLGTGPLLPYINENMDT